MADNVTVDNADLTDYVVASDDDGTAHHQYVKVEFGPDNTQTKVTPTVGLPVKPVEETAGVGVGAAADLEATGDGSVIALLKRIRTLLSGTLTVGGTVSVAEPVTVDGTVAVTHAALTELAGAIDTEMQVDVVTMPTVTIQDGGNVITVDGTVNVAEPVTVDGTVSVTEPVTVDGTVDVSSVIPGTGATNLGKEEDAAHTSGDVGVMALAVRNNNADDLTDTEKDYSPLGVNSKGTLFVSNEPGDTVSVGVEGGYIDVTGTRIEDDGHSDGNRGFYMLGVRDDTLASDTTDTDGDYTSLALTSRGAVYGTNIPHIGLNGDPFSLVHEAAAYTSTQTSTVLIDAGASDKLVITDIQLQATGTDAGDVIVYFGTGAFVRGTNRAIFDGHFIPSATSAPGFTSKGPFISGADADDLRVTTTNNIDVVVSVWFYVT